MNCAHPDICSAILTMEVDGVSRELVSACFLCDFINVHRRLIQKLVRDNKIKMYNGLLDLNEVLRIFPTLQNIRVVS